ncbi:PREDICTED: uncharacterized protein LOC105364532 [Ceratosolen solmsi marchali]|uniref:Uncharacterized protein LOC105364532 n=1 Tax=Ceratosolen solmsi marchali TaxID=326594 RepID=A0AAJ6YMI8_9HYME|nr:PREDICTED: uncharacterized protein LOC105364532 [Ceratosolen solmsi marchali]
MFARVLLLAWMMGGLRAASPPTWFEALRSFVEDCRGTRLDLCARRRALGAVDQFLGRDVIGLVEGIELVRFGKLGTNNTVDLDIRRLLGRMQRKDRMDEKNGTWGQILTSRMVRLLKTHVIKVDLDRLGPTILDITTGASGNSTDLQIEARGRRRRRRQMHLMPIMMMGLLLMGTVLIPMSFQFLAVLGGKALILAKMALMLSSIQGLKKIATNGVNYGLYHNPVPEAWHERSTSIYEIPYAGGYLGQVAASRSAVKSA